MTGWPEVEPEWPNSTASGAQPRASATRLADRHRAELAVDQADVVAVVDQRPADREQAERRQVVVGDAAADRGMRHVDQEDAHGGTSRP